MDQIWILPPILAYSSFTLAYLPNGFIRSFNKMGDYSYGVYIYSYPIQQAIVQILQPHDPYIHFLLSMLLVLPIAILSWYCIEKPALTLKKLKLTPSW